MAESLDLLDDLDLDLDLDPAKARAGGGDVDGGAAPDGSSAVFFGPYQLIQQVGSGGVAKVWRARHIHPNYADKTFAVKILHEELSRDPKVVELFRHEAYVLSLLKHPNIVETFEAGSQDDKLFIAMEYIDGRDLDNLVIRCLRTKIPLPIPLTLHIVCQALRALVYAHDLCDADGNHLGLIHRDVNPANVFISFDGRVKLGDFGVASITAGHVEKERQVAGKAGYFAPEQLDGAPVDQRADVFAVSVMLFEMLCGVRLFQADDVDTLMRLNRKAKIPKPTKVNPQISTDLEQVILRGLQRRPEDRFASGREMLGALLALAPNPVGMPLGVAALLRKAFLNEHIQEMQLRAGLAGVSHDRGSGQLVAVVTHEDRARAAFNELLTSRGYRVEVYTDIESFGATGTSHSPNALLLDVTAPGFSAEACRTQLGRFRQPVAMVGFAETLDVQLIKAAAAAAACDFIFKPFNIERVLTAVRSAIDGATKVASIDGGKDHQPGGAKPKVLILSKDPQLITRLSAGLAKRDYEIEVTPSVEEALERTRHSSHHAVIFDAHPATPADRFFASQFRGQPGMGLVPILYVAAPEAQMMFAGVGADRSAVRPRLDPPAVLVQTLNRLRGDTRLGRTFIRYTTTFAAELRYGGRVFSGNAVDVSRGGVSIRCADQMPPVGTNVGLTLHLEGISKKVQGNGRVTRVDLPTGGSTEAKVGVEFERFASAGETELIAFLATLDTSSQTRQSTMIMSAPPPVTE